MKITFDIPDFSAKSDGLFDSVLAFVITHVVFPLLPLFAIVQLSWLVWETLEGATLAEAVSLIAGATLIPLSAVLLVFRRKGIPLAASIAYTVAGVAFLYLFCMSMPDLSKGVDPWILESGSHTLLVFAGTMPLIFSGIARVASRPFTRNPASDFGVALLMLFAAPVVIYVAGTLFLDLALDFFDASVREVLRRVFGHLCALLAICCSATFFVALLHLLFFARNLAFGKRESNRIIRVIKVVAIALVLPLLGLSLNSKFPFPADFQNPWPYAFTIFTTLALLPEATADRRGLLLFFMRALALPFVLYFFLVFVPFLPLALPAIIVLGTGFLILAPTLLAHLYAGEMRDSYRLLRTAYPRRTVLAVLLVGALVAPAGVILRTEWARHDVRALLAWHAGDTFDGARKPFPPRRAVRILRGVEDYTNGNEIPLISAWTTQRVYGGMLLDTRLREELWLRFTGWGIPESKKDRDMNIIGSMWASGARRSNGFVWRTRPNQTDSYEATATRIEATEGKQDGAAYAVVVHAVSPAANRELVLPFSLPGGAWIAGMRLQMDSGEWKQGRISERKAAEWVYRKITEQRLDPSIVTLDSPTKGTLKVFPVGPGGRNVELTIVLPAPSASKTLVTFSPDQNPVSIATPDYAPETKDALFVPADAPFPVVVPDGFKEAHAGDALPVSTNAVYLVVDESCRAIEDGIAETNAACLKTAVAAAERLVGATVWLVQAHSTTTIRPYPEREAISRRGGLDAYATLRTVLRHAASHLDGCRLPYVILVGQNWESLLPCVRDSQWDAICQEFPGVPAIALCHAKEDGTIVLRDYAIPGAATFNRAFVFTSPDGVSHLVPDDGRTSLVFADVAGGKGSRVAGATWNAGAALWRRDRAGFFNPSLDLRRELLDGARACGVLTTHTSSIAVETTAQEKALRLQEKAALGADKSLEFEDPTSSDAPGLLLFLLGLVAIWFAGRRGKTPSHCMGDRYGRT